MATEIYHFDGLFSFSRLRISAMGSATSKAKKNSQKETDPQRHPPSSRGKTLSDTKKILLLHKSGEEQLKVVKNFRDALTIAANGGIRVINSVNIDEGTDNFEGLPWLELELNNVILICLTSEAIVQLETILREKRLADENGHLHGKVFSVSFGENMSSEWPPKGIKRSTLDARDFYFGFANVEKLLPKDFEKSEKMNALVAAIKGTD